MFCFILVRFSSACFLSLFTIYNLQSNKSKQYKQNTTPKSYKTKLSLTLGLLNRALNNPALHYIYHENGCDQWREGGGGECSLYLSGVKSAVLVSLRVFSLKWQAVVTLRGSFQNF